MAVYNVDKIDNWYNDFVSLKNKFNNTYYSDYKSSYIRSCSDSAVKKMQSSLDEHYSKIQKMYNSINTAWNSYLKDLKNTDRRLAGGKGGINASSVSSKLAKLPVLQEYKRSLNIRIKSVSGVVGTAKGIGWSENRTIDQNLEYLKNRVGATITTAGVSLVEGLGIFAEGLVDVAAITTTGIATVIAYATSDADEAREISDQIWEDCRAFTSKQYVKSAFNSFYENTDVGKSLKKDSYAFDVVRSVGNEVGEVLGAVGISVATGGVINPAILYGTSKAGTHIEENWQDENTSTAAGLVKGTLQGIGDGIFFALGMKGDAVMKSAAINAVKKGGQQALKKTAILTGKTLFECGCSVAQDGSNILINAIFSDDIVKSQDGKDVKLNSFGDKLNYYYNQAGGMEGLMTSMATASVLSFASDFVDVSKVGKNIDTNAAIRNADINANNMKNTIEGVNPKNIEVSTKPTKSDINLDSLKKEYDDLINWKNSDEGLYSKRFNEVYGDRYGSNSRYKKNMARIAELEMELFDNNSDQLLKNPNNAKVNISSDSNISQLTKEYDELLKKSKESWFVQAKEASDNGWAWDLNKVNEADNIVKRMQELESTLGIKNTGIPESKIYDYSQAKKEADELARNISRKPIPGFENIDTNSQEYKKAMQEIYSKPSPSGKQDLSQIENPFNKKNIVKSTDDIKINKASNIESPKEFKIVQEITGGAAADRQILKQVDEILDFDVNSNNIKNNVVKRNKILMADFKKGIDDLGGNQESALNLFKKIFKSKSDKVELQAIEDTIRKYYPDMTKKDMEKFLTKVNKNGCTYVATANTIFEQFDYNPDLFREKFGFEMYLPNGKLNQNQLIVDIYAHMSTKMEVKYKGKTNIETYDSWANAAKKIFGVDLDEKDAAVKVMTEGKKFGYYLGEGGGGNPDGSVTLRNYNMQENYTSYIGTPKELAFKLFGKEMDISEAELKELIKNNNIIADVKSPEAGGKIFVNNYEGNYLKEYLNSKGVSLEENIWKNYYKDASNMPNKLKQAYKDGYSISVSGRSLSMTDGSKFGWTTLGEMDGHAMILRGVTDEGNIIVSSWGKYFSIPADYVKDLEFHFTKIGVNN